MTPELAKLIGDLSPFAVLAILVLAGFYLFAPSVNRISASNDRLAAAYSDLNKTLTAAQQESAANAKAIGGLAESTSQTGVSVTNALEKIALGLDTTMQRQQQHGEVTREVRDTSAQTLANVLALRQPGGMEEMVGKILGKVLDLNDAVKELNHPTTMTLADWQPLDERLAGLKSDILNALARSQDARSENGANVGESQTAAGNTAPDATADKKE